MIFQPLLAQKLQLVNNHKGKNMSNFELVRHLFLQLALILFVCRCVVFLGGKYLKQTEVVCEMIAGVLLGPSFFGLIAPEIKEWLFPSELIVSNNNNRDVFSHPSMSILYALSHIGLVLYMFLVGVEFKEGYIHKKLKKISIINSLGILSPFLLGILTTFFLYNQPGLFQPHIGIWSASLYFGIMVSITAFPTLARMLNEKNMSKTNFGSISLVATSIGNATAWCLLALALSCIKNNLITALAAIIGGVFYVLFFHLMGKKILTFFFKKFNKLNLNIVVVYILIIVMLGAWIADAIGIYSVFGAFIIGLAIPRGKIAKQICDKIQPLTNSFLLPIFFAYSGLNTGINLVDGANLWATTFLVIIIAIIGKGVFCTLATQALGGNWKEPMIIVITMNCHGLMELIILNMGLENNIITSVFFTIGVLMALVTTLVTSPLFKILHAFRSNN